MVVGQASQWHPEPTDERLQLRDEAVPPSGDEQDADHQEHGPADPLDQDAASADQPQRAKATPQTHRDNQERQPEADRVGEGEHGAAGRRGVLANGGEGQDRGQGGADAWGPPGAEDHPEREGGQQPTPPDQPDSATFPLQPLRPPYAEQEQAERGDQDASDPADQLPLGDEPAPKAPKAPPIRVKNTAKPSTNRPAPATTAPRARAPPSVISAPDNPDTKPR
jgi:hypothetical protein